MLLHSGRGRAPHTIAALCTSKNAPGNASAASLMSLRAESNALGRRFIRRRERRSDGVRAELNQAVCSEAITGLEACKATWQLLMD